MRAPFAGYVQDVFVKSGERIEAGADVALMQTQKVYAPADGTVSGVFAKEGDSAKDAADRYGAAMYVEPANRYRLDASTQKSFSASENKYVHIGETVYLFCTRDGSHTGTGFVAALDEKDSKKFTVEVTEGEFYMSETVGIFRDPACTYMTKIGQGTVIRTPPIAVSAEGSVLRIHVRSGDSVARGDLLMETVEGTLDALSPVSPAATSESAGIVASVDAKPGAKVEKGAAIATVYPADALMLEIEIGEAELGGVKAGDEVEIEFGFSAETAARTSGTICDISYLTAESEAGSAAYHAYVSFAPDDDVRIGMTAVVYMK